MYIIVYYNYVHINTCIQALSRRRHIAVHLTDRVFEVRYFKIRLQIIDTLLDRHLQEGRSSKYIHSEIQPKKAVCALLGTCLLTSGNHGRPPFDITQLSGFKLHNLII